MSVIRMLIILVAMSQCACDATKEQDSKLSSDADLKEETSMNTLSEEEKNDGWMLLFDGKSTQGWRGFNKTSISDNWIVENGTLKSEVSSEHSGDIVFGEQEFGNFDLRLDWKIAQGGNSGIMYHVLEGETYGGPHVTGPEYQLIDDLGYEHPLEDWQKTGNDYAMYSNPERNVKPHSEWNTARILFTDEMVSYWLNGQMTVSFVPWSEDWHDRKNAGKWKDYPDYGMAKKGLICLQDHGSDIWFRNIKIKVVD